MGLNDWSGDIETDLSSDWNVCKKGPFVNVWNSVKIVEYLRHVFDTNTGCQVENCTSRFKVE